jgi:phosphatidylserine/phosphatidylglycerophosphate/cardiolipin synthase-like enzyme
MIDSAHAIAHNKIMIIDGETVITGSFNCTKAAEEMFNPMDACLEGAEGGRIEYFFLKE